MNTDKTLNAVSLLKERFPAASKESWILRLNDSRRHRRSTAANAPPPPPPIPDFLRNGNKEADICFTLDTSHHIVGAQFRDSRIGIDQCDVIGHPIGELCTKDDRSVIETLVESSTECSAELHLRIRDHILTTRANTVKTNNVEKPTVIECNILSPKRSVSPLNRNVHRFSWPSPRSVIEKQKEEQQKEQQQKQQKTQEEEQKNEQQGEQQKQRDEQKRLEVQQYMEKEQQQLQPRPNEQQQHEQQQQLITAQVDRSPVNRITSCDDPRPMIQQCTSSVDESPISSGSIPAQEELSATVQYETLSPPLSIPSESNSQSFFDQITLEPSLASSTPIIAPNGFEVAENFVESCKPRKGRKPRKARQPRSPTSKKKGVQERKNSLPDSTTISLTSMCLWDSQYPSTSTEPNTDLCPSDNRDTLLKALLQPSQPEMVSSTQENQSDQIPISSPYQNTRTLAECFRQTPSKSYPPHSFFDVVMASPISSDSTTSLSNCTLCPASTSSSSNNPIGLADVMYRPVMSSPQPMITTDYSLSDMSTATSTPTVVPELQTPTSRYATQMPTSACCSFANNSVQYSPECATYTCDSPMAPLSCRSSMQQTAMLGIDSSPTQMVQSPSNSVIEPMMQPCLQQQSQQDYLFQNQPAPQQPPRPSHSEAQAPPAAMAQQYQHQRSLAMPQYPSKTINLQQSGSTRFPCPSQYPLPSHYASYQMSKQSSVSSPYQVPVACQQQQQQQQQQQRVYPPSRSAIAPPAALCTPQQYSQPANLSQFQMPLNPASSDHLSPYNGYERPANPLGTMVAGGNTQWSRRPASRSEMIRMELRHSVQARQQATSPINPSGMSTDDPSAVRFPGPTYQRMMSSQVMSMPSQSESATVLADPPVITSGSCTSNDIPDFCMPLDFPDEFDRSSSSNMSQTSAIPTELYDFKLGNGRFDMDSDATKCLVQQLLS